MKEETLVDRIAVSLGLKAAQLRTADVHAKIPVLKRKAADYEAQAVAAEESALKNRAKAFSPDTPAAERAKLMRQSTSDAQRAKTLAGFASTFLTQYGHFSALETAMRIADEMKDVGLISSNASVNDWQGAMDSMQDEIEMMIESTKKLGDVMSCALTDTSAGNPGELEELDRLFAQYEAEKDPVRKAEIQRKIEAKSNAALA
jgi:hypothetical protein